VRSGQRAAGRRRGRSRWHPLHALLAVPLAIGILIGAISIVAAWYTVNWVYQTTNKPAEVFFPWSGTFIKTPAETWQKYRRLFNEHATAVITPEFLAALAQVEGGGNPVARTYWRWRWAQNPFELYQPASSSVGMYQITDATFREAKRYCIHDHVVVEEGPWDNPESCWFNSLYTRIMPSHAIELTAALLDRSVASALERQRITVASLQQKQDLAAVIHLCGAGAGDAYAKRGFQLVPRRRCGDHDVGIYLLRVNTMKRLFARLADTGKGDNKGAEPLNSQTPSFSKPRP
jgi:hypothetical protein